VVLFIIIINHTIFLSSYDNYEIGLKKYHIQTLILTKSNFNIEKLNNALTCLLEGSVQNLTDKILLYYFLY